MLIPILRNNLQVSSFKATDTTMYTHARMGVHKISAAFVSPVPLSIQIGDYIIFKDRPFTINIIPYRKKNNNHSFDYQIDFEAPEYKFHDKILMNSFQMSDFTYYGTAADILELIIVNVNQIDPGWSMGSVDTTEAKHITFAANTTCMAALTQAAELFGLVWYPGIKTMSMTKDDGVDTGLIFERGSGKGLYRLSVRSIENKNLVTKAYGYGSTKNLPLDYRGGIGRLTFEERFFTANTDMYGIKEGAYTDEEIFPRRLGVLTAVGTHNPDSALFTVTDLTIDFNISDYIQNGVDAKVSFITGELAGSDFVITDYNTSSKAITLRKNTDGEPLPNDTYQPAIGDEFVLIDIEMPAPYVAAAEAELRTRTQEYLAENSTPQVSYDLELNLLYLRDRSVELEPGYQITVRDNHLGIDKLIRINDVSYSITFPSLLTQNTKYIATVADEIVYTPLQRIKADTIDNKKEIEVIGKSTQRVNAQIDNAKSTLERVKGITNFLTTTIDGNVVATGTLLVGDALGNNTAGITGVVDQDSNTVWLWGGAPYASRYSADFRVLKNGMVYATRLKLGYGTHNGVSTGWDATPSGIISDPSEPEAENFALIRGSSKDKEFSFGTELLPSSAGGAQSLTGRIRNVRQEASTIFPTTNTALRLEAKGANKNIALDAEGDIQLKGSIRGHSVKTFVLPNNTELQVTDEGAIFCPGNGFVILPPNPQERVITINGQGGSIQIKSPDKTIKDRGETWQPNTYMTGIVWGRTLTFFPELNAWVCSGYLN